jgi:hypothetical protein
MVERHFVHVASQIKLRVVFPTGKSKAERSGYNTLEIAREERQLRLDKLNAFLERDLALEKADARYIERHAFPFQVQEDRVAPGKAVTLLVVLQDRTPIQLRDQRAP